MDGVTIRRSGVRYHLIGSSPPFVILTGSVSEAQQLVQTIADQGCANVAEVVFRMEVTTSTDWAPEPWAARR